MSTCRFLSTAVVSLCLVATLGAAQTTSGAAQSPAGHWQRRLEQIETDLRRLPSGDASGLQRVAADLATLRQEVTAWLAADPAARNDMKSWLEEPGTGTSPADLAVEIGRLRAALSRIAAALGEAGDTGAFYLGRVDVEVTAARSTTATTEMTPAGASVLDALDVRENNRPTLSSALALAPGVNFTRIGQRNETTVYVRGFDMRQVPLFVDGIPIYTPYDGYVDLERFTTFDVAELQVSKGFASVLYGPNALGGAINIVSRRPLKRLEGVAGASYASGSSGAAYVNAGARTKSFYLQGGVSYLDSDTFPLADPFVPTKNQPAGDRLSAYKQDTKFNVKAAWTPNGTDEYAVSYVGQRGEKGNPPYAGTDPLVRVRYWQWPYWDKDSVYLVSNTRLGSSSYIRGRAFYDTYDNALYSYDDATYSTMTKASSFKSIYHDYTAGASAEWGMTKGRNTVRAAFHFKGDAHQDHNVGDPVKNFKGRIISAGVEDTLAVGAKLSLVGGISGDWQATTEAQDYQKGQIIDLLAQCETDGTSCGSASGVNPQVGLFYSVPAGLVRFTVSRKTRMPSLKDRYSYRMGTAVPNPDLAAEHNLTVEGGYQGTLGAKTTFQASVFYSSLTDAIQRFYVQPNVSQLRNIGEATHAGFELDARTRVVPRVDLGANYTYLYLKNVSDPATPVVDAPRHKGRVSMTGTITDRVRASVNIDFEEGRQSQNEAGTYMAVPSFLLVNFKGVWTIRRGLEAELALFNAFDQDYWYTDGYPEAGRTALAGVRWTF